MVPPQNIRTTVNSKGAKTTTYMIPEQHLPLVLPFKYLGVDEGTLNKLDGVLQPMVDAGYSRNDDPLTAPITVDPVNGYDPAAVTAPATQARLRRCRRSGVADARRPAVRVEYSGG